MESIRPTLRSVRRASREAGKSASAHEIMSSSSREKAVVSERYTLASKRANSRKGKRPHRITWSVTITHLELLLANGSLPELLVVRDHFTRYPLRIGLADNPVRYLDSLLATQSAPALIEVAPDVCVRAPQLEEWAAAHGIEIRMVQAEKTA